MFAISIQTVTQKFHFKYVSLGNMYIEGIYKYVHLNNICDSQRIIYSGMHMVYLFI